MITVTRANRNVNTRASTMAPRIGGQMAQIRRLSVPDCYVLRPSVYGAIVSNSSLRRLA